jgi:hypothetical protein
MVSKNELLARAQAGRVKAISVDGLDLFVRRLTLGERIDIGDRARKGEGIPPHEYLTLCLCNEDGSAFFTLEEAEAFCDADGELAERVMGEMLQHAGLVQRENAAKN